MIWVLIMTIMGAVMGPRAPKSCDEGEMLPLLKRHEIQVLLNAGFTKSDVAARSGTSVATVKRVSAEMDVEHTDDRAHRRERRIGRPSTSAVFGESVAAWLKDDPELPTQELLRRARDAGYEGGKSAFYSLVASARPSRSSPVVRFEGLPGEFSQHDFGQVDVRYVDGRTERIHFFASRLKYSRFARVTVVENERVETILRCLARDFVAFGGLPLMAVFDRPRTIVQTSGRGREVEVFNGMFAQGIVDLGVGVEMCAPRSGNQKGSVERLVGWVKSSFFKPRKFQDKTDLLAQLERWLFEINTQTASRATGTIPETRRREELARLRPIKVFPEKLALRVPVFVGPSAEVMFEGVPYSMPPQAAQMSGTMFVFEDCVRIVVGRWSSEQRRRRKGEPPAAVPEHRAAKLAAVRGPRAKLYEKREQLLSLGTDALALLTEITHKDHRVAGQHVNELYTLLERYGDDRLRSAIGNALRDGEASVEGVARALQTSARRDGGEPTARRRVSGNDARGAHNQEDLARPRLGAAQPRGFKLVSKRGASRRAVRGGRRS